MNFKVLYDPKEAEGHPFEVFFVSFVYALVGSGVALIISSTFASILLVLLTLVALLPMYYRVTVLEAKRTENIKLKEFKLLRAHVGSAKFFAMLFFGLLAGFFAWFIFSPTTVVQNLFSTQIATITSINSFSGQFSSSVSDVHFIFFSNLRLLGLTAMLSLIFGAGAFFILSWNASIIAVAMGSFFKDLSGSMTLYYLVPVTVARYLLHGTLEIVAYFLGGLAGSILFVEIVRHRFIC